MIPNQNHPGVPREGVFRYSTAGTGSGVGFLYPHPHFLSQQANPSMLDHLSNPDLGMLERGLVWPPQHIVTAHLAANYIASGSGAGPSGSSIHNNNSAPVETFTEKEWNERLAQTSFDRHKMDALVLDHFISEANQPAAEAFAKETGQVISATDSLSLSRRAKIRNLIKESKIMDISENVTAWWPSLMETDHVLRFRLQQLDVIRCIRAQDVEEAVRLCQTWLAPTAVTAMADPAEHEALLTQLEHTMSLITFGATGNAEPSGFRDADCDDDDADENGPGDLHSVDPSLVPFSYLLTPEHNEFISDCVNAAIVKFESSVSPTGLPTVAANSLSMATPVRLEIGGATRQRRISQQSDASDASDTNTGSNAGDKLPFPMSTLAEAETNIRLVDTPSSLSTSSSLSPARISRLETLLRVTASLHHLLSPNHVRLPHLETCLKFNSFEAIDAD